MRKIFAIGASLGLLVGLFAISRYNYLLFHTLAETFSIVIACGIFMVAWNARRYLENDYLLVIGIAYLFIGLLDMTHTVAFKGMNLLPGYDANTATQLWVASRYLESATLLTAPLAIRRRTGPAPYLAAYSVLTVLVLLLVFYWKAFPDCYLENAGGLTRFKVVSEYIISAMLLAAGVVMIHLRRHFDALVLRGLVWAIGLTVLAELCFTFYMRAHDISNLLGHYFKIASFYLIYKAIIVTGLAKPYDLLFRELQLSKENYRSLFMNMINGFANHRMVFDASGKPVDYIFMEVNAAFQKLTGLGDVTGRRVTELLPGIKSDPADWIGVYGKVAATGASAQFESYSQDLDRWYSVMCYRPAEGQFATVFEDITVRRQAEEALRAANAELEDKVRERTCDLTRTVESLRDEIDQRIQVENDLRHANILSSKRADQLRILSEELTRTERRERMRLSKILHDGLQQNLAAIKMQLGCLGEQIGQGRHQPAVESILRAIDESIQVTRSLSADLCPVILYESGLPAALAWLAGRMQGTHNFQVDLSLGTMPPLPEEINVILFECVRELLFNAVKHARVFSARLEMKVLEGSGVCVTVSDQGRGFDPRSADAATAKSGGLGLFSIRERIALIGGLLDIDSAAGQGSRISLLVPYVERKREDCAYLPLEGAHPDGAPASSSTSHAPVRLLIADDHALFREGLWRILGGASGVQLVGYAEDGQEAIDLARRFKPDVILMDIRMPRLSGIEATRLIHQELPGIRIVGLSMHDDQEGARAMMLAAGASAYHNKACSASELLAAIHAGGDLAE